MAAQKKYEPTRRRLKKARDDGDVAKSRELTAAASLIGALLQLSLVGFGAENFLLFSDEIVRLSADFRSENMIGLSAACLRVFCSSVLPVLGSAFIFALIAELYQVGWLFKFNLLVPRFSRLSFTKGFCRLFGISSESGSACAKPLVESAKLSVYLIVGGVISALVSLAVCRELLRGASWQPEVVLQLGRSSVLAALYSAAGVLLLIGTVDYIYQQKRRKARLRMDANELKQELRENEGDPQQRGMRKQLHFEIAAQNIAERIRSSRVVVLGGKGRR